MSSGAFVSAIYASDDGEFWPCRVQPETLALTIGGTANAAAAGPLQPGRPSANMTGSKRKNGVNARQVRVRFTGAVPDGYEPGTVISLPVLTSAAFNDYGRGLPGSYLGVAVECVGKTGESIR